MKIAIIGLGRMGFNIALHALEQGVDVVAWNRSSQKCEELKVKSQKSKVTVGKPGLVEIAHTLEEIPKQFRSDRCIVFLYVPAGEVTDSIITQLGTIMPKGSIIIDGGNSFFKDSQKRYQTLKEKGIHFLDMGTSGGIDGARTGACLMVGGDKDIYDVVAPIFAKIATKDGYGYMGPVGCGHYVKMIHNAVEYGMMGAIAEGMNLIKSQKSKVKSQNYNSKFKSNQKFNFDLAEVARVWAHGSIVSGLLMDKAAAAFDKNATLSDIKGTVPRGETEGEMEWLDTIGIPNPVIQAARKERVETRKSPSFIGKVVAAMRKEFGGHKTVDRS